MKILTARRIALAAAALLASPLLRAADLRFDVSTSNNAILLPNLAFPSANGHIDLLGGSTYQSTLTAKGNTLGIYYNNFNSGEPFTTYPNPHDMAVAIQTYVNQYWTTPGSQSGWIALNEVSSSNWQNNPVNSAGYDYHTWCIDVVALLKNGDSSDSSHIVPAHTGVILWAPFGTPGSGNRSSWQAIAQYAYIADERYIDGATVQSEGYSVSAVQSYYQQSFNAWVNNAGIPADRLILSEEYTNSLAGNGYGANGLSGEAWQAAIECRNLAAYNVGFAGYVGYAWGKNAQGSSTDTLISYENSYASTMVVPTEIPCWTGNNASVTGNSWADYLNWTGGLPSTTSAPFPLLAASNPNLPKQTSANFYNLPATTIITLDGNQSVTNLLFSSSNSVTIGPGTGGSLTMTGTAASISVASGSHTISAGAVIGSNVAADLTGNLTLSGGITNSGFTLTKSGNGMLTIAGAQSNDANSAIAVSAGTVTLNSDAGSAAASHLALSQSGGTTAVNSSQHLFSLSMTSGNISVAPGNLMQIATTFSSTGGQIVVHTAGISIDNNSPAALSLSGGEHAIVLDFDTPGTMSAGPYWGLRWQGDHVAALSAYLNQSGFAGNGEILVETNPMFFNLSDLTVGMMSLNGVQYTFLGFAALAGDYNADGRVDAADYVLWRKTDGTPDRYNTWRMHFGQTAGSGASAIANATVPEPASILILLMGMLAMSSHRHRPEMPQARYV
ncbi:MAG TPA: hypothetical protein VFW73_13835 [Lacipirellulaceae bacterium]|nr:hypothetical protein [Lacipirellulaceae bacterium]